MLEAAVPVAQSSSPLQWRAFLLASGVVLIGLNISCEWGIMEIKDLYDPDQSTRGYSLARDVESIRNGYIEFCEFLVEHVKRTTEHIDVVLEDGHLRVVTPAGELFSSLSFHAVAGGTCGMVSFWRAADVRFEDTPIQIYRVKIDKEGRAYSGDRKWEDRPNTGWIRSEAERLGFELFMQLLALPVRP